MAFWLNKSKIFQDANQMIMKLEQFQVLIIERFISDINWKLIVTKINLDRHRTQASMDASTPALATGKEH